MTAHRPIVLHVLSDVQGRIDHLEAAMRLLCTRGAPDRVLLVGDVTDNGTPEQYDELLPAVAALTTVPVIWLIGNHEFYNDSPSEASLARFLDRTGMAGVYGTEDIGAARLIWLGTIDGSRDSGHDVVFGPEQLEWFERLLATTPLHVPVLVFTHQPLPDTVSGTGRDPAVAAWEIYADNHAEAEEFARLLAGHPRVVLLTGHSHWRVDRDDWLVRVETEDAGFWALNTGALHSSFGPDGKGGEYMLSDEDHSCLRVSVDDLGVRIEAFDVSKRQRVQDVTLFAHGTSRQ